MTTSPGPARGILRHVPAPGAFQHARVAPPPALADVVQHYWIVRWDLGRAPAQTRETLPHPNVHWVMEAGGCGIHGVHNGRFTRVLQGRGEVFGIKFRPGGFHGFLRQPVSVLRNASILSSQVFGADATDLEARILAQSDDQPMLALANEFLLARRVPPDAQALRVGKVVDDIAADRAIRTLDHVASRWNLRPRTLQRLFRQYVGIGPKWVIGRYRLHEALARVDAGGVVDWAALALDLGYFDQAHFIRDFRALVGCTPGGYARRPRAGSR